MKVKIHDRNQLSVTTIDKSQLHPKPIEEGTGPGWLVKAQPNHVGWMYIKGNLLPSEIILIEGNNESNRISTEGSITSLA